METLHVWGNGILVQLLLNSLSFLSLVCISITFCPNNYDVEFSLTSQECAIEENEEKTPDFLSRSFDYGGELSSQSFLQGTFSRDINGIYYTLSTTGSMDFWGVITSSLYDINITVYYYDTNYSTPFLTGTNFISYIPACYWRTTYILLQKTNPFVNFAFSVSAIPASLANGDYLKYDIGLKTLSLCSYVGSINNFNYPPIGNTTVNNSDLGSIDGDGLRSVLSTGDPYDSVANIVSMFYHDSTDNGAYGTAFRIRQNLFATNCHNLFSANKFAFSHAFYLYPGRNSSNSPYIMAVAYYIPIRYLTAANPFVYDFALVETSSDSSSNSLGMEPSMTLSLNDDVYMLGYPSPVDHSFVQQYSSGQIHDISSSIPTMLTTIPAGGYVYGGSSGSPVFKNGYVVGINNGSVTFFNGAQTNSYQHAILFDSEIQSFVVSTLLSMA